MRRRDTAHQFPDIPTPELEELLQAFPRGVIAFDLEMTGLSPLLDRIVELGAIKMTPTGMETFHQLINPQMEIPQRSSAIHGLTLSDLREQPALEEILPRFLTFIDDLPLVAHNARFDLGLLITALHHSPHPLPGNAVYCTLKFCRHAFPERKASGQGGHKSLKLAKLCQDFGISLKNHHCALDDAWACLRLLGLGLAKIKRECGDRPSLLAEGLLCHCSDFQQNAFEDIPASLQPLVKAAKEQTVIDIAYRGGSRRDTLRPVRPIGLLPMPQGHFLYALCLLDHQHKFFALKKVAAIKELTAQEIHERLDKAEAVMEKVE